jgi:O-antigen/teichoic acid export membrane protein
MLRNLVRSASIRAAFVLGAGGVAFTVCNLVLARMLPTEAYGVLTLVIGILSVASLAAPWGLDLVIARRGLTLGPGMRRAVVLTSLASGFATAAIAMLVYDLPLTVAAALFVATTAAGVIQGGVAHFQGQQKFGPGAWLLQLSNAALIPAAIAALFWSLTSALVPALLIAAAGLVGAVWTCWLVVRSELTSGGGAAGPALADASREAPPHATPVAPPAISALWREAVSLVAITVASSVFLQLERLVLVPAIGVAALALFGVVAALVGSPFRMIQQAVLFTLIPGMRAANGLQARRALLRREMVLIICAVGLGSVVLWFLAPPLAHLFLGGRYELAEALMLAAIVSGLLKVFSAFATSVAVALGSDRDLRRVSATAWVSIGVSVAGAFIAAPWGLTGALYGISVGWLTRTLAAAWIAAPHLMNADGNPAGDVASGDLSHPVR